VEKARRSERISVMCKMLLEKPRTVFPLGQFAELFDAAKSTISEDLGILKEAFQTYGFGQVETITGAAGGAMYVPNWPKGRLRQFLQKLAERVSVPERIIPGGFLYMADIIYDPLMASQIGEIFATCFSHLEPDVIMTMETKGIPLALMTARAFRVPLVIVRDASRVTEGSSVSINYVSGSTHRIQTMSLSRRALPTGSRVIIIDDFMKAGGTARGMKELSDEFGAKVLGIGVLISTNEPRKKLVDDYLSLLTLEKLDEEERRVFISPGIEA